MMDLEMLYVERVLIIFISLVVVNIGIVWLHRYGNENVKRALATYELHSGYLIENSPLMKKRREQFDEWRGMLLFVFLYAILSGILLGYMGEDFVADTLKGMLVMGILAFGIFTGFGLLQMTFSLLDAKNPFLSDVIPSARLTLITLSKQINSQYMHGAVIRDEDMVKKLIEANPIIDELCRLNKLREGISGKADTDARKQTLAELEELIDTKNAELMPFVDIVFASVGAVNPLVEAESSFNEVEKEIALTKERVELTKGERVK